MFDNEKTLDRVVKFISQENLLVGDKTMTGCIIAGNLPVDGPQLHAVLMDDYGRLWKETCGEHGSLTLIFDRKQGWL